MSTEPKLAPCTCTNQPLPPTPVDDRYVECRKCGEHDRLFVWVQMHVIPGDGVPWIDGNARPADVDVWECDACDYSSPDRSEVCFVGYPGITQEEIDNAE